MYEEGFAFHSDNPISVRPRLGERSTLREAGITLAFPVD